MSNQDLIGKSYFTDRRWLVVEQDPTDPSLVMVEDSKGERQAAIAGFVRYALAD